MFGTDMKFLSCPNIQCPVCFAVFDKIVVSKDEIKFIHPEVEDCYDSKIIFTRPLVKFIIEI